MYEAEVCAVFELKTHRSILVKTLIDARKNYHKCRMYVVRVQIYYFKNSNDITGR